MSQLKITLLGCSIITVVTIITAFALGHPRRWWPGALMGCAAFICMQIFW